MNKEELKLRMEMKMVQLKNLMNHLLYDHVSDYDNCLRDGFVKQEELRNAIIDYKQAGATDEDIQDAWRVFYKFQTTLGD